jgi:hypothetical protein
MGSFLAGIKAGTLSGVLYVGGIAVFNVLLLYALQPSVINAISQANPSMCPIVQNVNGSAADCFSSLIAVDVPFIAFVAFFITLLYAGAFGLYYDSVPTHSATFKGLTLGVIVAANLLFFGFSGYIFDYESGLATGLLMLAWTPVFGYLFGRLYKKYTWLVEFKSQDRELLKVVVDGRDYTSKARTFAATSTHKVRAEVADDASFKEWTPSGGVTLEDQRSFETVMEVNGDGTVTGKVGPKY